MYLSFMTSYNGTCLVDDYNNESTINDFNLPNKIIEKINDWNEKYSKIIPMSEDDRQIHNSEIEELDSEGIKICIDIKNAFSEEIKIRYFSEGKLKYLT